MQTKTFIVPHDFTAVADIALQHAIATAKPLGAEILVLHVVSKETQIPEALACSSDGSSASASLLIPLFLYAVVATHDSPHPPSIGRLFELDAEAIGQVAHDRGSVK
jgi:nucleotide-binding universal stress UspA family protein